MQDNKYIAPFILALVYIVATVCFIPGLILTIGAGSAFYFAYGNSIWAGVVVGTLSVWVGAQIGSIVAFILGRFVFRESIQAKAQKIRLFEAILEATRTDVSSKSQTYFFRV